MAADVISVDLPMTFKRRGGRKVIVLPDGTQGNPVPAATLDNTMIKAIARAFRWQRLLENGTYGCLEEIAKAEKIGASFVSRIIRLALLAPDIVEAILAGKQPASLTLNLDSSVAQRVVAGDRRQLLLLMRQREEATDHPAHSGCIIRLRGSAATQANNLGFSR